MKDYLLIGFGLAGVNLAHELEQRNQSFTVIDAPAQNASKVAGGITNPLILKRFTKAWNADQFIPAAESTYKAMEKQLGIKILSQLPIYRKIKSVQEQNDWFVAADQPDLQNFMSDRLKELKTLPNTYAYGEVKRSSLLNTESLLAHYQKYLTKKNQWQNEKLEYHHLQITDEQVTYKNLKAKKIIFCEGYGMLQNPYFNKLPLIGNKGEYLILKIPGLQLDAIVKTALALIPLGKEYYKFGASYSRHFTDTAPNSKTRKFLIEKLEEILDRPYEVIAVQVGVRPTVRDRRPLLGRHPKHQNLLLLNGLGSHGVMVAPTAAQWLLNFDLDQNPLPKTVDLNRYYTRKKHHLRS